MKYPCFQKIISVADSYEAMTANRSYKKRKKLTKVEANRRKLKDAQAHKFDPPHRKGIC